MAGRLDDKVAAAVRQLPHRLDRVAGRRINGRIGAQPFGDVPAQRHRIDDDHPGAHADRRRRRNQTDRSAARDHHRLGGVGRAIAQDSVVAAGERFDQGAFRVIDRIRQLVQPLGARGKILAVGAVHREAEMVDALRRLDHAFADHAIAALQAGDVLADFDDLADPFVAGDDGVGDRDDVMAGEKLVVGVADADATRPDHHFIVVIEGDWTCETIGFLGSSKIRAFIAPSLCLAALQATASILPLRAEAKTASSSAILLTRCAAVIG